MSVGTSDGQNTQHYEEEIDHIMNNPIEHDFDTLKSGRKPIQEPTKPGLDIHDELQTTPSENLFLNTVTFPERALPLEDSKVKDKLKQQHIQDILFPGKPMDPVDKRITPGDKTNDPMLAPWLKDARDIRVSEAAKTLPIDPEQQKILDEAKFKNLLQYYIGKGKK